MHKRTRILFVYNRTLIERILFVVGDNDEEPIICDTTGCEGPIVCDSIGCDGLIVCGAIGCDGRIVCDVVLGNSTSKKAHEKKNKCRLCIVIEIV